MTKLLTRVARAMDEIAPLSLAERWDNVGILVESPREENESSRVLVTVDFTGAVLEECVSSGVSVVVAYHPTIFKPLKRLVLTPSDPFFSPTASVVMGAIQHGISIFSPHTALDACLGGINDWICGLIGHGTSVPIVPNKSDDSTGAGRYLELEESVSIETVACTLAKGFGTGFYRLALGQRSPNMLIKKLAICAGSDLLVTGEMGHHDVLASLSRGLGVLLFEHSHTERRFLADVLVPRLSSILGSQTIVLASVTDSDPLSTYSIK